MSKRLEKYIEDKIGILESDVNPNKAINDLFGVEEKPLKFSTQSTMVPDKMSWPHLLSFLKINSV